MAEIITATGRAEFRAFFGFSEACGYSKDEAEYLELYASPAMNPIRTGKRAYLYLVRGNRIAGRLLTWKDDVRDRATGGKTGFFSLCDTVEPGCEALFDKMLELQKSWGSTRVYGPISPDGSGFFNGLACEKRKVAFCSPHMQSNLPEEFGFGCAKTDFAYTLDIPDKHGLERAAKAAADKYGLRAKDMSKRLFRDPLPYAVCDLFLPAERKRAARQAERIAPYIDRGCSFGVYDPEGECRGYLLTLRGERKRVATLMTGNGVYPGVAVCALLWAAKNSLDSVGVRSVDAGVIDSANTASIRLAENTGCLKINTYKSYIYSI